MIAIINITIIIIIINPHWTLFKKRSKEFHVLHWVDTVFKYSLPNKGKGILVNRMASSAPFWLHIEWILTAFFLLRLSCISCAISWVALVAICVETFIFHFLHEPVLQSSTQILKFLAFHKCPYFNFLEHLYYCFPRSWIWASLENEVVMK